MEKFKIPRVAKAAAIGVLGVSALTACGQTNPPTPSEIENNLDYFVLEGVTAANGEPVRCAVYGSESTWTNDSKSWFGFVCDFEGTATFPGEI